jgi:hypothetical protein
MQHSHSFQSDKTTYRRGVLLVHFVTYRGVTYCFVTYYYVMYRYAFIYPMIHRYSLQTHYFFPMFSSISLILPFCYPFSLYLHTFPLILPFPLFLFPLRPYYPSRRGGGCVFSGREYIKGPCVVHWFSSCKFQPIILKPCSHFRLESLCTCYRHPAPPPPRLNMFVIYS